VRLTPGIYEPTVLIQCQSWRKLLRPRRVVTKTALLETPVFESPMSRFCILALFAPALLGVSGVTHAFNITFETIDCDGQSGFVSVPVEHIYRIDGVKGRNADVVLPAGRTTTQKKRSSNIRILNSSIQSGPATQTNDTAPKSRSCPGIESNPKQIRRVSVRRPDLEPVHFDVFFVTTSQAKKLTHDIKRYMAARRTSLERGSSITVETR